MFKACKKSFKRCFLFPNPSTFLKVDFSKNLLNLTNNSHLLGSMVFMCPNNTLICLIHLSRKLQTMERKIYDTKFTHYIGHKFCLWHIVQQLWIVFCVHISQIQFMLDTNDFLFAVFVFVTNVKLYQYILVFFCSL